MFINLELYRIFYITATSGSISKAAAELFTSQPAVSHSIKQLEQKLGGQLFYRNAKGVILTTEGDILFRYIEQGYGLMLTAERKFSELKQMNIGQLRISVCSAVLKHDLFETIKIYNQKYPNIKIQITDESSQSISKKLAKGEIDIGVLNLHGLDKENIDIIKTIQIQDCFIAGEKYKNLCNEFISLKSLSGNYPLIMLQKGGYTREYIDLFFQSHEVDLTPQIELSNLDLMVNFAINGLGIACVAKKYVQKELNKEQLFELRIEEQIPARSMVMATKKGMPISTATQKFIDIINTVFNGTANLNIV